MSFTVLHRDDLPFNANTHEFQGVQHQETNVSFIWVDMPPGGTIGLHKHPCEQISIIQDGRATFMVDSDWLDARAGQIMLIPAEVPHKFMNLSDEQWKQIDICFA